MSWIKLHWPCKWKLRTNWSYSHFNSIKEWDIILHRWTSSCENKDLKNKYFWISFVKKIEVNNKECEDKSERLICKLNDFYLFKNPISNSDLKTNSNTTWSYYWNKITERSIDLIIEIESNLAKNNDKEWISRVKWILDLIWGKKEKIVREIEGDIEDSLFWLKLWFRFYTSLYIILIWGIVLLNVYFWLKWEAKSLNEFIWLFLWKWVYLFFSEFITLYVSYYFFSLSKKYLQIIEIYKSYKLLFKIEKWSSLKINDVEFEKENIRKLYNIQNITEKVFWQKDTKWPFFDILDKVKMWGLEISKK